MAEKPAPLRRLLGASLLSAVGSLPTHIGPLIVVAAIADGRFSIESAGWILSVRAVGELLACLALPAAGLLHLSRSAAMGASASLLAALGLAMLPHPAAALLGFFIVGACSGLMKFLGTMAASAYRDRTFAFIVRLALTLAVAGAATCILLAMEAHSSWSPLLGRMLVLLLPVLIVAGGFYGPLGPQWRPPVIQAPAGSPRALAGLALLLLFFVGISGFFAFVAQQAATRGMSVADALLSIGAVKIAAGAWLLAAAYLAPGAPRKEGHEVSVLEACLLIAALWSVYLSSATVAFLAAFLLLEVTLNGFSARLQSAIVSAAPHFSGLWLNSAILLGTAMGPPLYGVAIGAGLENAFVALSSLAICLPIVWQRSVRSGPR